MTNPFAAHVPTEQPAAPAAGNPYAQQPQQQAPQGNPYAQPQQQPQQQAPAAPQAYVPQGNPYAQPQQQAAPAPMPQAYMPPQQAPAAQAYAPAPQQQAAPPSFGPVGSAAPPVIGAGGAMIPDMYGRLVIMFPHQVELVARPQQYITDEDRAKGNTHQERLTATVVVLDAGMNPDGTPKLDPIWYGGDMTKFPPVPHDKSAPLPYVRKALWIRQTRLISQARDYLPGGPKGGPGGQPGIVGGRVTKAGPEHNAPWYLIGMSEQEIGLVNKYLEGVTNGHFPNPLAA